MLLYGNIKLFRQINDVHISISYFTPFMNSPQPLLPELRFPHRHTCNDKRRITVVCEKRQEKIAINKKIYPFRVSPLANGLPA